MAVVSVGYFYGIIRANIPNIASHFLFDASVFGFYLSQSWSPRKIDEQHSGTLMTWLAVLIAWPCVISVVPFQNVLVTLVGLRTAIFFLPFLLFGARLNQTELQTFTKGLATLNLVSLGFGILEYIWGVENFFPRNEVTIIIYISNDMAGGSLRIPSIFMSAHAYAGAMVMTIPLLFGGWVQRGQKRTERYFFMAGLIASLIGVLLAATRVNFAAAAALVIFAACISGISISKRVTWIVAMSLVAVITAGSDDRMKRFETLTDANVVNTRINMSVNQSFWEILENYPFGNGLGGGGTSMPYFLANQVKNMVSEENEFAHILAEQGAIGLLIWIVFLGWLFISKSPFKKSGWRAGRLLAWFTCLFYFGTALIGTGMLSAVPATVIMLLLMGWISADRSDLKEATQIKSIGTRAIKHRLSSLLQA